MLWWYPEAVGFRGCLEFDGGGGDELEYLDLDGGGGDELEYLECVCSGREYLDDCGGGE